MKNTLSKRLLSLLLCLAMFLGLGGSAFAEPQARVSLRDEDGVGTIAPAEDPEPAFEGESTPDEPEAMPVGSGDERNENPPPSGGTNPYFKIANDMVGGTVTDSQNIYEDTSARGKQLTPGLLVTLTPHPYAGYELRGWSIICSQNEAYYLDVDDHGDWAEFVVGGPYNNRYTFVIRAEFEYTGGGYPIDCYSVDATGLGSSISVDRETAKVGDTVTITVDRKPGTALDEYRTYSGQMKPYPYACFYCNEDYTIPGGYYIPLTKESDSVYTFVVPEDIERYIKEDDQKIYVYAEFKEAEFFVTVDEVSDPEETGNTVTVDKESAGLGDTVTVSVMSRYATDYGPEGLQVFWLDENEGKHPLELTLTGSSVSPYSSSGELTRTYTFTMPEHNVHISADFVKIGHRISTAPADVPGQMLRGRYFKDFTTDKTNLSVSPNEQRAVAGDTITAEMHVEHEENMGSYGIRSAYVTWEENGVPQRQELGNVRYDEYLYFLGDFVMPDADTVLHAELERSWWVVTEKYTEFSLDPDKWEAFAGDTVTVTANLFDEGSETFAGWTWTITYTNENEKDIPVSFTYPSGEARTVSFVMPAGVVSVELHSPYEYINRWWTGSEVKSETVQPTSFKLISSLQDNENLTLTSGVWIVSQSRSFSNRLTISGDVHLVLCDGATLTCSKGIELAPGNSLTVYGQKEDTGGLICTGPEYAAGIGGGDETGSGSLTIHGGTVTANGGDYAAGVGTGDEANQDSCGSFTMLGGSLTATGGTDGAGIGGGNEVNGGAVTVYNGSVTANGGDYAAGIGGGDEKDGGTVIIYNGTVTTTGGPDGAGIGGGESGNQGGSVTIYDGTVTTEGGRTAAGIGGGGGSIGDAGNGGTVSIHGGTVEVTAGLYGAGIGGGSARGISGRGGNSGDVTITGGKITIALSGQCGAGIGGGAGGENFGYGGDGGDVTISGGKISINMFATRSAGIGGGGCDYKCGTSGSVNISGGELSISITSGYIGELFVESQGAGIGGAAEMDQGGDIRITGGVVMIDNKGFGAGIGGGASEKKPSEAGDGGNVYINNAFVIATSQSGAGIGGGGSLKGGGGGGNGGNVTIDGGTVYAISSNKGAGIGGGNDGDGGTLTVNGGYVMATGGYLDYNYIRDHGLWSDDSTGLEQEDQGWTNLAYNLLMHFIASGEFAGAGIGGGDDGDGGTVIINGGTVIAISGMNSARAFGRGDGGDSDGSVRVYNQAKVTYGTVEGENQTILGVALTADRESTCMSYAYARVELCDHPNAVYTCLSDTEHRYSCPNCAAKQVTEAHVFDDEDDHDCDLCGYERVIVTLLPGQGSGNAIKAYVTKSEHYTLPECSFTGPNGLAFAGWQGSVNGAEEATYPAGSSFKLTQDLTLTALWNNPYRLWVNGVQVTSDNRSDVLGGGTVVYDPETCTLTLNGPGFTDTHEGALIYADDLDLTIAGSGVVTMDDAFDTGVRVLSGSLTIDGDISVAGAGTNGLDADEDVILQSGVIAAQGGSYGIRAGRSIYVRRDIDRVTADGSRALSYEEIDADPGVTVVERTSANRLPPEDEWDLENANHVVFDQGVVVSFVLNGGEMEGETGTVLHNIAEGMTVSEPDPAPTREGYTFGGWYTDEGLTLAYDFETELDEDISIYAKWTRAYPVEIRWEKGDELEAEPESVRVVLQRGRSGEWTTVGELTVTAEDEWKGSLEYVPGPDARDDDEFRIREIDEQTGLPVYDPNDDSLASDRPTAIFMVGGEQRGYLVSYKQIEDATTIINSSTKQYSVELSWDIDLGDQDRPDEIEVVLQKQEGKFSWKSVQVITLDPSNGWSGEFDTVPLGYVNDTETFVFYEYRIRELEPKSEEEEYETEEERLAAADERVVYNTYDFDKPFIANLIKAADPENLWTFDYTTKWLMGQAKKILIPAPTFKAKIDAYTDTFGKEIKEHETKYHVKYTHNSTTHHMSITDTAVLDIDVRKIWVGYEDDELPESVYLMLMSKVDDDYAEQIGVAEINIYTPVATVVYGSQVNLLSIPGVEDGVKNGLKALLGDGFMSTAAMSVLSQVVAKYTNTGLAIASAKGDGNNPLTNWRVTLGVKKYGSYGVPMEFAGVELVTGFMEMAVDAIIKQLGIPKISCPVMYHPIYKCWSIKGYAIPFLHDYAYTCNVINVKFDGDESEVKQISGTKTWVGDTEAQRPEEILIHVYARGEDDSRTEITGSPVTVTAANDWTWSLQIPLNDIAVVTEDGENSSVTYKEIVIEEEVPDGYEASYDGYNITNTLISEEERIEVAGAKTWDDLNNADGLRPESITIRLLADGEEVAAKTVTASDGWAWCFEDLPKNKASGAEIVYSITEDPVEGYVTEIHDFDVTNIIISRVYGYNVNLKGRIGLNVYLFIPQRVLQDGGLYVTLDSKSFPVASAETRVVDGLTLYKFSEDKAAKEMKDLVTVQLYGSGGLETLYWHDVDVTNTGWSYCIQTYTERTHQTSSDLLLLAVVDAMSDFGSLAQAYFPYNADNRAPVVGNPDSVTLEDLAPYEARLTEGEAGGVSYAGSRLVLKSGTVIRHYFTIDEGLLSDYSFQIGSKTVTPVNTEDGWMIEIPDVYARYLDEMYTVTVTREEESVLTLRYSALSYAHKIVQNNDDPALVILVKAMYLYNRAAEAYFTAVEG